MNYVYEFILHYRNRLDRQVSLSIHRDLSIEDRGLGHNKSFRN